MEQFTAYAYRFGQPMLVEPRYGWAIPKPFEVFRYSFPYVSDIWDKNKRKPSTLKYLSPKKIVTVDAALTIRYYWQNYYHFFMDTLSQVYLANKYVPADVPILVPHYFHAIKYVQEFLNDSTFLNGRKIIVQQQDEYYAVKELYICKGTFYSESIYDVVKSFGDLVSGNNGMNRKIFLKRDKNKHRAITNSEEIEQIAVSRGFEVCDTDGMSLKDQVRLFTDAGMVVGLHGAGLTNIIFRHRKPMKLLELFPADSRPDHYRNICTMFGYGYDFAEGGDRDKSNKARFYMDPAVFSKKIDEFLA